MTLTIPGYRHRIIDPEIDAHLRLFGALSIQGPKWCGKTTTALHHANSVTYLGDPAANYSNRRRATLDPAYALQGDIPHLIDEWQEAKGIWDAVRFSCDQHRRKGMYILTGSSVLAKDDQPAHTGTGRIERLTMRTMSLMETGDSTGETSLRSLFDPDARVSCDSAMTLDRLVDLVARGGWPDAIGITGRDALVLPRSYIRNIAEDDISRIDNIRRDPAKALKLMQSLARNESTLAKRATLVADASSLDRTTGRSDDPTMSGSTFDDYMDALRRVQVIEDQPAWDPALRSPIRIRAAKKRHFADPSLAVAAMGATQDTLLADLKTFGNLFEALCVHDLRVYAQAMDARVFHYRDSNGLEADAIVERADGSWGAFEMKLGPDQEEEAAAHLLRLRDKLAEHGQRPPACLAIICGIPGFGYTRPDGVHVIPIDRLGA